MREEQVESLSEFVLKLNEIADDWYASPDATSSLWFRGQQHSSSSLLPTLYRPEILARSYDERTLLGDFMALAPITPLPVSDWEWYFLARHHGLPSRLLDWTENALTALWFAVSSGIEDRELHRRLLPQEPETPSTAQATPSVWLMDAASLNKVCFGNNNDSVFFVGGDFSKYWLPDLVSRNAHTEFTHDQVQYTNQAPIAVFPARRTHRIIAQQGVFTVHGFDRTPIEEIMKSHEADGALLARILLAPGTTRRIFDELDTIGLSWFGLFPDADHLAKQLEWNYW